MFECSYCHRSFVREHMFLQHNCKTMIRTKEIKSMVGQTAYSHYCTWMKLYRRASPSIESFMISKFYNAFIKFTEYAKEMQLPDVTMFIQLMVDKDFSPHLWTNDKVYVLYIEYLDRKASPFTQASITISTMIKFADANDIDVCKIFDILTTNDVMQYIRERKMSPWILLASSKFKHMITHQCTPEERAIFEQLIRPVYWKAKFDKNPDTVIYMKAYVKELGL